MRGNPKESRRAFGRLRKDRQESQHEGVFGQRFIECRVMSVKSGDGLQLGVQRFQKFVDVRFGEHSVQRVHRDDDGVRSDVMEPKIGVADGV